MTASFPTSLPAALSVAAADTAAEVAHHTIHNNDRDDLRAIMSMLGLRGAYLGRRNLLINGDFRVVQRGSNVVGVNDTYQGADRWITLQGSGTGPTIRSDNVSLNPPARSGPYCDIGLSGGGANKYGRMQIIESQDMYHLRGGTVSLGFNLITTAEITDVRAAVLAWSGTADTVTSDPVSSWAAAGTNPTLATSWAYANTPSNVRTADATWARVRIEGITVPSNATNLAVFIWNGDVAHTINTQYYAVNDVQLEEGPTCTGFERRPIAEELALCKRYYERSYAYGTATGTATQAGASIALACDNNNSKMSLVTFKFNTEKRTTPIIQTYDEAGNAGKITTYGAGGAPATHNVTPSIGIGSTCGATGFGIVHVGTIGGISYQWTAEAEL